MKFPVDIHTHRLPPVPGTAIANRYPDTFVPEAGAWYSVGIHPWHIPATATPVVRNEMNVLASLAGHPQVLAIGEAGLDKLADAPMAVQIKVFEYQARLSVELDKPLVIHLVKAMSELLKLKQQIKLANPWIIHGFRGKAALAEECLRHGFLGRVFMVSRSVAVSSILFSNFGSKNGLMSFSVPHEAFCQVLF